MQLREEKDEEMEFNRNQYFMVGLVILFIGLQFRFVETFVLSQPVTLFLAEKTGKITPGQAEVVQNGTSLFGTPKRRPQVVKKEFKPPKWLGLALMSIGGVLILHSLAMRRPEG